MTSGLTLSCPLPPAVLLGPSWQDVLNIGLFMKVLAITVQAQLMPFDKEHDDPLPHTLRHSALQGAPATAQ